MQGTEKRVSFTEQLGRYSRYMRSLPRLYNPVVPMLGAGGLVTDSRLRYVASCSGDDADECIREAVRDGLIELHRKNPYGYGGLDLYRITARGEMAYERFRVYQDKADARCREMLRLSGPCATAGNDRGEADAGRREGGAIPFDEFIERVERGELLQVPEEWAAADEKERARRAAAEEEAASPGGAAARGIAAAAAGSR